MKNENIASRYIRYSKRIVIISLFSWVITSLIILGLVWFITITEKPIDEFAAAVLKNVMTCTSGIVIAATSGYYAHSSYENSLQRKITEAISFEDDEEEVG